MSRRTSNSPLQGGTERQDRFAAFDIVVVPFPYADRLAELKPEAFPAGSPERDRQVSRRLALAAAYERLRDAINTTETRFEKLEF